MKKILKILMIIIPVIIFNGCYNDKEVDLYPNSYCDMTVTTYSGAISKIFSSNCALSGCHNGAPGSQSPDFSNYNSIAASKDRIMVRAVVQKDMPKGSALSPCDISKLKKWLDDGALNN